MEFSKLNPADYYIKRDVYARAANVDCDPIFPRANELFLDFDSDEQRLRGEDMIRFLEDMNIFTLTKVEWLKSKSGNDHCIITLDKEISDIERVALQAALCSDPRREILNVLRLRVGEPHPITLFRPRPKPAGEEEAS